jgi:nitroimidazol reductase NimA-like FMN-containing flavoprotein (pyridoxamine 5'-phosphate oxidase superfamily)
LHFAQQAYLPRSFQPEITNAYCQGFADASAGVIEEEQQGMVAFSLSTPRINRSYDSASLFRFQIDGSPAYCSLVADGKNAAILARPRDILSQEMLHKTADGRESAVPGDGGVPSFRFDMFQKSKHVIGLDIFDGQVRYRFVLVIGQKQVEQF